jgi:hypothetical protein
MNLTPTSHLSDTALVAEVKRLARCEREASAQLIARLAELDARQLYLAAGFSSLFTYCCEVLLLSEHESYCRIEAARAAQKFPAILGKLAEGALNLTTVRLLASHLTEDNHQELIAEASGRTKRQVEELLASRFPRRDTAASIRKLPARTIVTAPAAAIPCAPEVPGRVLVFAAQVQEPAANPDRAAAPAPPVLAPPPPRPAAVTPLAADRFEFKFTGSGATRDKLRLAQDLLRHSIPTGDMAEIFDRALTVLVKELAREKFAATERPRTGRGAAPGSRYVAAKVKRAVWLRDGGQCAFVGKGGRRCTGRGLLEFHHVDPYALGGEATVDAIELRCRAHNNFEAQLWFGPRRGQEPPLGPDRVGPSAT